ncbi:hypothetical protein PCC8801_1541 [Rippkaea orientalis PCC 8801]|uniref:CzcB-like C-terminal circularly permuted SH3-like domain-containing protein n=1 Tax=Rippkaea orientalis (strain PCC 8801 / RF-1) TaxID=41431 RepID=B7JUQ0_RIPO1|nr:cobalt transporter [Rippkaea orientalis]ACK65594.1 hypothetical protein PCC8801_1541 [Rippkaea orientalis PCC 8801]
MRYQNKPLLEALLITTLLLSVPKVAISHVGHGDEFQATGGIERVQVNPETDQMLGIVVTPIDQAVTNRGGVMIPITALVDAGGKKLVFVQYGDFYEPVEVTTGATQGELIQVTKELSVGEKLVTQGSLSLYAESRKTKTAETELNSEPMITSEPDQTHAQADAQGTPHSHDSAGNMLKESEQATQEKSGDFPRIGIIAAIGGGAVLLVGGAIVLVGGSMIFSSGGSRNKSSFTNKR